MDYSLEPAGTQARYKGRERIVPTIDWSQYRVTAHVDTMEIDCVLRTRTQMRYVRDGKAGRPGLVSVLGGSIYVAPIDPASASCREWRLTVQDPTRARVEAARAALDELFGVERWGAIYRLDVSVDAAPRALGAPETVLDALLIMEATFLPPKAYRASSRPRVVFRPGAQDRTRQWAVWSGGRDRTFYWGSEGGVHWRAYYKEMDRDVVLPESEHRARLEVSLDRETLKKTGLGSLVELEQGAYPFRALKEFFGFWLPTAKAGVWRKGSPMLGLWARLHHSVLLGASPEKLCGPDRAGHHVAYGELNEIVRLRLKKLRWS